MAFLRRAARPRGVRPELPSAVPGTSLYPGAGQWGDIALPLPSATTVLGLPAAGRAVNLIANAVALMTPLEQWTPDGYRSDETPTILSRPNAAYGCYDYWHMACSIAIMRGNFLAIKADLNGSGFPQQLVPVPTGFWLAYYDEYGYLVYDVGGVRYSRDDVFHIRVNAEPNRPMGVGVVTQYRRAIGQALDQQNFAADTYRSGSVPAGVITLDLPEVDPTQAAETQAQWIESHSGGRAPAVLPSTMKFEALTWNPEDMQFLQARQFTVGEIAHMFNMDPSDLGAAMPGTSQTYSNIEQRQEARISDTYAGLMRRIEEELSDCLAGGNSAKMVPNNLMRTDSKTRAEVDQLNVATGVTSSDEARKRDGRKPLPKPKAPAAPAPGAPGAPAAPGAPTGAPGAVGTPGAVEGPTPIPGTDITATPVKVKE